MLSSGFLLPVLAQSPAWLNDILDVVDNTILERGMLVQLGSMVAAFVLALFLAACLRPFLRRLGSGGGLAEAITTWLADSLFRLLLAGLLWAIAVCFDSGNFSELIEGSETISGHYVIPRLAASLATLWFLAGALPGSIRRMVYFRTLFFIIAVGLALHIAGLWDVIRDGLARLEFLPISDSGETRVTALTILKGLIAILIVIPLSRWVMRVSEHRIKSFKELSPALQELAVKFLKSLVVVLAILFSISAIGINLSSLALLGGAVGLGLGFGFQKVVSNLISGVILLADRSIKPGDVIEVDDTYGWINKLSARYVSVITRDGTEHLIPNETLITDKVTNWSFSDDRVRIKIPFGVSYDSDIHRVMDLAKNAAKKVARVLPDREPVCWLIGFGENSVDFELRVWIRDPANGIGNLRSEIYVNLWDFFKKYKIEIPFPQRDLHLRDAVPVEVRVRKEN